MHLTSPLRNDARTDGEVTRAQKLLRDNPFHDFKLPVDGQYGPISAAATKREKYWLGYPTSKQTVAFGPNIHDYLSGNKKLPLTYRVRRKRRIAAIPKVPTRVKAMRLAKTQIGVHESPAGSNRQKYGEWYGANGQFWCAMFVSWCFTHVGRPLHYAYVPYIVDDARAGRNKLSLIHWSSAMPGDLVCFDWEGNGVADHIGIIVSIDHRTGAMVTIEGNTSKQNDLSGSQSNGGIVAVRTNRTLSEVQAFVRVH